MNPENHLDDFSGRAKTKEKREYERVEKGI